MLSSLSVNPSSEHAQFSSVLSIQQIQRSALINKDHCIIQISGLAIDPDGILKNGIQDAVPLSQTARIDGSVYIPVYFRIFADFGEINSRKTSTIIRETR